MWCEVSVFGTLIFSAPVCAPVSQCVCMCVYVCVCLEQIASPNQHPVQVMVRAYM